MDKRLINIILELSHWVETFESNELWYSEIYEVNNKIDALQKDIEDGKIGYWGNSSLTPTFFDEIKQELEILCTVKELMEGYDEDVLCSYEFLTSSLNDYKQSLSSTLQAIKDTNSF